MSLKSFVAQSASLRLSSLMVAACALALLGGCQSERGVRPVNPAVFAAETAPVWGPAAQAAFAGRDRSQSLEQSSGQYPGQSPDQLYETSYASPFATPMQKAIYGQMVDDGHTLNAIPLERVNRRFLRQEVDYPTNERPGTIVVDTQAHYLYLVERNGKAIRYGVGLGKQGFAWKGRGVIQFKKAWPRWTPSDDMVARSPDLRAYSAAEGGLEPGLRNPLGARAMYIFQNGKDTLYRVHGTPDWQSVGKAVSSGCVRMFNQDVIDLYERVSPKAEIVVL